MKSKRILLAWSVWKQPLNCKLTTAGEQGVLKDKRSQVELYSYSCEERTSWTQGRRPNRAEGMIGIFLGLKKQDCILVDPYTLTVLLWVWPMGSTQ